VKFDSEDIRILRRYTGKYFTAANGYDFRKPLSRSRTRTVLRYLDKIREMTHGTYNLVTPVKGQKRELFRYTGQTGFNAFAVAIVRTPKKTKSVIVFDKSAPKGERVSVQFPRLKQREVKIKREHILYFIANEDEQGLTEFIEQQAPDAELFLINTEGGAMWRKTAGNAETVAEFIFDLAEKYGAGNFSKNTYSHFDNWIDSISAFSNFAEAQRDIAQNAARVAEQKAYFTRLGMPYNLRYSDVHDALLETDNGDLLRVYSRATVERALKDDWKRKSRKTRRTKRDKAKGR
jgi:hypothetical protein